MKLFFLLTLYLISLLNLYAQDSTSIIITDSSTISILYSKYSGKIVSETFHNKDLVHLLRYDTDFTTLKSDSYIYKTKREAVGLTKYYDENGKLKIIINNDNQTWLPIDTMRYPHYKLLGKMKEKADSILQDIYCPEFVTEHLQWNIVNSYYFDSTFSEPSFTIS